MYSYKTLAKFQVWLLQIQLRKLIFGTSECKISSFNADFFNSQRSDPMLNDQKSNSLSTRCIFVLGIYKKRKQIPIYVFVRYLNRNNFQIVHQVKCTIRYSLNERKTHFSFAYYRLLSIFAMKIEFFVYSALTVEYLFWLVSEFTIFSGKGKDIAIKFCGEFKSGL